MLSYVLIAFLRYNSHTIQVTHLMHIIYWFLVFCIFADMCKHNQVNFRIFSSPQKETPCPLTHRLLTPPTHHSQPYFLPLYPDVELLGKGMGAGVRGEPGWRRHLSVNFQFKRIHSQSIRKTPLRLIFSIHIHFNQHTWKVSCSWWRQMQLHDKESIFSCWENPTDLSHSQMYQSYTKS